LNSLLRSADFVKLAMQVVDDCKFGSYKFWMAANRTIQRLEARHSETINPVASLGFIGLATDRASFRDFCDFTANFEGVEVFSTRIPFVATATPRTLAAMEEHLAEGTKMLIPGQPLQSISFSCTSGTIAIGVDNVHDRIHSVRPESEVVTPIEAAMTALRTLKCQRISLLMPYLFETAEMVADHFEANGFSLDNTATFDLGGDPEMNTVSFDSLYEAGLDTCDAESDALFISCTGWRTQPVIDRGDEQSGVGMVCITLRGRIRPRRWAWSAFR